MSLLDRGGVPLSEGTGGRVPPSALAVSILALAIAGAANLFWPSVIPEYSALLWLLALVPPFLLAYHKGWQGAALALAAGMVLLIGVEVGGSVLTDRAIRWWTVGGVIAILIAVSLGAGSVSEKLRRQAREAMRLAYADPLTGLPNRRVLDLFLEKEFAAAQRGTPLAIALFDIDGFKTFNDRHGHTRGDEVLLLVARVLERNTRAQDKSGRLAGDEFLTLLLGEKAEGALVFADRVRRALHSTEGSEGLRLSAGVAAFSTGMRSARELLDAADRALYAAKRLGGDRVVLNAELDEPTEVHEGALALLADGQVRR